ncbi:hypothetical protein CDAR_321091 [Caerostris darwini]|uniref:Uncharacterized protein n=1 Tax=Caerostris darwini TaxID=1538125 RepID=A0AAV4X066_9ARAC|nr:hypothetical protein CDAR_321091 [Caerostris darwini]
MGSIFYGRSSSQGQHLPILKSPEKLSVSSNRIAEPIHLRFHKHRRKKKLKLVIPCTCHAIGEDQNHPNYCLFHTGCPFQFVKHKLQPLCDVPLQFPGRIRISGFLSVAVPVYYGVARPNNVDTSPLIWTPGTKVSWRADKRWLSFEEEGEMLYIF